MRGATLSEEKIGELGRLARSADVIVSLLESDVELELTLREIGVTSVVFEDDPVHVIVETLRRLLSR